MLSLSPNAGFKFVHICFARLLLFMYAVEERLGEFQAASPAAATGQESHYLFHFFLLSYFSDADLRSAQLVLVVWFHSMTGRPRISS